MKNIGQITYTIDFIKKATQDKLLKTQNSVANKIKDEIVAFAPLRSGKYISSIKVSETIIENETIKTFIYSDLPVGGNNPRWSKIPLAAFLEWGTGIKGESTNSYPHGYSYRRTPWCYYDKYLHQWVTTRGMVARPHFLPALNNNREYFKEEIRKALKK